MKKGIPRPVVFTAIALVSVITIWVIITVIRIPSYVCPDTSDWHTGDVFFSVGDSWKSVAVRSLSGAKNLGLSETTPSHSGIVIVDLEGVKLVHESTSAGKIVMETPDEYLLNNGSYCLYARRPRCIPDSSMMVCVLDSLMKAEVPFDYDFDHSDDGSLYCTEMVVRVFELSGSSEFDGLRELGYIYPQDLLNKVMMP